MFSMEKGRTAAVGNGEEDSMESEAARMSVGVGGGEELRLQSRTEAGEEEAEDHKSSSV
jgi:hypothetical protein